MLHPLYMEKSDYLVFVLCCFVVCMALLASLPVPVPVTVPVFIHLLPSDLSCMYKLFSRVEGGLMCMVKCMSAHLRETGDQVYIYTTRGSSFFFGNVTALGVLCCFALLFVWLLSSYLLLLSLRD